MKRGFHVITACVLSSWSNKGLDKQFVVKLLAEALISIWNVQLNALMGLLAPAWEAKFVEIYCKLPSRRMVENSSQKISQQRNKTTSCTHTEPRRSPFCARRKIYRIQTFSYANLMNFDAINLSRRSQSRLRLKSFEWTKKRLSWKKCN